MSMPKQNPHKKKISEGEGISNFALANGMSLRTRKGEKKFLKFRSTPKKLHNEDSSLRILEKLTPSPFNYGVLTECLQSDDGRLRSSKKRGIFSKTPFKVLDAPGLNDDYYIDILDWSY